MFVYLKKCCFCGIQVGSFGIQLRQPCDSGQSEVAQLIRTMAESSAAALTLMTDTAARFTQRADAANANLKAIQSQVNVLLKRMDTDQ